MIKTEGLKAALQAVVKMKSQRNHKYCVKQHIVNILEEFVGNIVYILITIAIISYFSTYTQLNPCPELDEVDDDENQYQNPKTPKPQNPKTPKLNF